MGVLACARDGCRNIMCDTYVPRIGYICYECQKEFKLRNSSIATEDNILNLLKKFMDTEPSVPNDLFDIDKFFDEHMRDN